MNGERSASGERSISRAADGAARTIAILAQTRGGARLGRAIVAGLDSDVELHVAARFADDAGPAALPIDGPLREHVAALFPRVDALVFILALGATVRLIAPLLRDKHDDPAVLAIDEAGAHVIPVVGGHGGGANALAERIAAILGARAVVTTASDGLGLPAVDLLGRDDGWKLVSPPHAVTRVSAAVVDGLPLAIYAEAVDPGPLRELPEAWPRHDTLDTLGSWDGPALIVTDRLLRAGTYDRERSLVFRTPSLVLGVGCSLGASADELERLARDTLAGAGFAADSVGLIATIDRRLEEPGVVELAARFGVPLRAFTADELASVDAAPTPSAVVARHVGTPGVCEPAAILGSDGGSLVVPKRKSTMATVAVARRGPGQVARAGSLALASLGPGPLDLLTPRARRALLAADSVVGYRAYLDSLAAIVPASAMRPYELGQERERAAAAIDLARAGQRVALVSSGDVGVYAMAGLVYELLDLSAPTQLAVEVIPGVTAATAAAALLGAPLMLDFVTISLSDLLVPWDTIERRLIAAGEGDLVVALYNPASARRRQQLTRAKEILLRYRPAETPLGIVREAYRPDQSVRIATLAELDDPAVDMKTIAIVGNSATVRLGDRLVARRGYRTGANDLSNDIDRAGDPDERP